MGTVNSTSFAQSTIIAHQKIQKPFDFNLIKNPQVITNNISQSSDKIIDTVVPEKNHDINQQNIVTNKTDVEKTNVIHQSKLDIITDNKQTSQINLTPQLPTNNIYFSSMLQSNINSDLQNLPKINLSGSLLNKLYQ
jgi:hypothetical protein